MAYRQSGKYCSMGDMNDNTHQARREAHRILGSAITAAATDASPLWTLPQTAAYLGKSVKQLEWMIYAGTAPRSAKIGGRRMFRRADVEAFVEAAFSAED